MAAVGVPDLGSYLLEKIHCRLINLLGKAEGSDNRLHVVGEAEKIDMIPSVDRFLKAPQSGIEASLLLYPWGPTQPIRMSGNEAAQFLLMPGKGCSCGYDLIMNEPTTGAYMVAFYSNEPRRTLITNAHYSHQN